MIVTQWALYCLLGLAFSLSFRVAGFFDLSIGAAFLLGGYSTWWAAQSVPLAAAFPIGIALASTVSILVGLWGVAPLASRLPPLNMFVVTLGVLYFVQSLAALAFGESAKVLRSGPNPTFAVFSARISFVQLFLVAAAVLVTLCLAYTLARSGWGRFARAIADDRHLADLLGVPIQNTLLKTYATGGAIAGIAGSLFVADRALDPAQAMTVLLAAMVAAILGGEAILGAALGALVLACLESGLGFVMPGFWKSTVVFCILLAVLALRGGGMFRFIRRKL